MNEKDKSETILSAIFYRASCPIPDKLLQYQNGLLSMFEQRQLDSHFTGCPHCSAEINLLSLDSTTWLNKLRAWAIDRVKNRPLITLQPIAQPMLALRGTASQRYNFQSDDYRISLSTEKNSAETLTLTGSVVNLTDPLTEFAGIALLKAEEAVYEASIDNFGFFTLDDLPSATYALLIDLPEKAIWIKTIEITNA